MLQNDEQNENKFERPDVRSWPYPDYTLKNGIEPIDKKKDMASIIKRLQDRPYITYRD